MLLRFLLKRTRAKRFTAQAAHVAEMHFGESGLDLGEQQLGQFISLDLDLDIFMAGIGYVKQTLAAISTDPGMYKPLLGTRHYHAYKGLQMWRSMREIQTLTRRSSLDCKLLATPQNLPRLFRGKVAKLTLVDIS